MLRFDQQWFDAHRCQWCGKKCRPRFVRTCKSCKHSWWQHTLLSDGHCSGKRELETARHLPLVDCDCQQKGSLQHNPTAFAKELKGFGLEDSGFFYTRKCAVEWALHAIKNRKGQPTNGN
jgi:hypothetical protein